METRKPPSSPIRLSGASAQLRRFRLDCAALTAPRPGRTANEDCCLFAAPGTPEAEAARAGYLFAVIDGASAGGRGGAAAQETLSSLLEILDDERRTTLRPDLLLHRLQDANHRVHEVIRGLCVVTALWIWEDPAADRLRGAWAHVGDTRLYRFRDASWTQLTRDHARGPLLERAVGEGPGMLIDTGELEPARGDRFVLLSDGVWKAAPPGSVISGASFPGTAEAVRRMVGQARVSGSGDDTTAILVSVRDAADAPEPEH